VFIGKNEMCPKVLDRLSETTSGSRFAAHYDKHAQTIKIIDRQHNQEHPWRGEAGWSTFSEHGE
jgi:hypothetical protein